MAERKSQINVKIDLDVYRRLKSFARATERSVPKMIKVLVIRANLEDLGIAQEAVDADPVPER